MTPSWVVWNDRFGFPGFSIAGRRQMHVADVDGPGVQVGKRPDEARREILVEEQPGVLLSQPGYS